MPHPSYVFDGISFQPTIPPPETIVWRYTDLAKYLSLISTRRLFFPSSGTLREQNDPFEGSTTRPNADAHRRLLEGAQLRDDKLEKFISEKSPAVWKQMNSYLFISCWHMNDGESMAMWSQYASRQGSIAITSTVGKLLECFPAVHEKNGCMLSEVIYVDYDKEIIPEGAIMWRHVHKRLSFKHEREVRLLSLQMPPAPPGGSLDLLPYGPPGVSYEVEINRLITGVRVAPTSPPWFRELVVDVSAKYGVEAPVQQSSMDASPCY